MGTLVLGKKGEDEAARYLKTYGYIILEKNFRSRFGEIDLIARDRDTIVFVEVKSRTGSGFGSPAEAVGRKKLQSIIMTSEIYLSRKMDVIRNIRYDVIEAILKDKEFYINHIKNVTM